MSKYACKEFQNRFPKVLDALKGNVHQTFEALLHEIHTEISTNSQWNSQGSTAVISFIDKETHQIYTATLGDSEANIYRKFPKSGIKSIPLSPIKDWSCEKEMNRLFKARNLSSLARENLLKRDPKDIRSRIHHGVNVSRALGDLNETGTAEKPIVIHKPKITVNILKPGDTLIIACDGLRDFVSESEIANIVQFSSGTDKELATELVDFAINNKSSTDNVSVIALRVT